MIKPFTIFYVDDDTDDLEFFNEVSQGMGTNAVVFTDGNELLSAMENPPPAPAVVFLDLNMPGKNGFELLSEIIASKTFAKVPVVILSTASDKNTVDRTFEMGASKYMVKQRSIQGLRACIEQILEIDWLHFTRQKEGYLVDHC